MQGSAVLAAVLIVVSTGIGFSQTPSGADPPVKAPIASQPITAFEPRDRSRQRFGALHFRGGLELRSPYKYFGEISGLRIGPDGSRFLAVSDKGRWWRGRIVYDGDRPSDIADSEMAPMLGPDGKPLRSRGWYDAEAIAEDGGTVYVGIERAHQILRFDYGKHGLLARGEPIAMPAEARALVYNRGVECLAFVAKGRLAGSLIAIAEDSPDTNGNHSAFLIGGREPGSFAVKRTNDFAITDCALLPAGDLLILERRFKPLSGIAMRIRRLAIGELKAGALLDGPALIEADLGYEIDNMEGLSAHRSAAGDIVLTLVSDDNSSSFQRTILLQFTLVEP
jgi:hypothetical protein